MSKREFVDALGEALFAEASEQELADFAAAAEASSAELARAASDERNQVAQDTPRRGVCRRWRLAWLWVAAPTGLFLWFARQIMWSDPQGGVGSLVGLVGVAVSIALPCVMIRHSLQRRRVLVASSSLLVVANLCALWVSVGPEDTDLAMSAAPARSFIPRLDVMDMVGPDARVRIRVIGLRDDESARVVVQSRRSGEPAAALRPVGDAIVPRDVPAELWVPARRAYSPGGRYELAAQIAAVMGSDGEEILSPSMRRGRASLPVSLTVPSPRVRITHINGVQIDETEGPAISAAGETLIRVQGCAWDLVDAEQVRVLVYGETRRDARWIGAGIWPLEGAEAPVRREPTAGEDEKAITWSTGIIVLPADRYSVYAGVSEKRPGNPEDLLVLGSPVVCLGDGRR